VLDVSKIKIKKERQTAVKMCRKKAVAPITQWMMARSMAALII
jgi:hypothetical protein